MCKSDVVRAWKDEDYRMTLSEAERMMLPANPAGLLEISDSQLGAVAGGDSGTVPPGVYSCFGLCNSEFFPVCSGYWAPCTGGDFFCPIFPVTDL